MPFLVNAVHLAESVLGKPHSTLSHSRGDISLGCLINFRVRLVINCPGLAKDMAVFHPVPNHHRSPLCPLCLLAELRRYISLRYHMCSINIIMIG